VAKTNGKKPAKRAPAKKAPAKAVVPQPAPEAGMPYLTSINVSGFKCFVEPTPVELGPLTVLAGANSSGKSSIMQPLLLIKQTLESSYNASGPFLLNGPNVRFTDAKQFLFRDRSVDGFKTFSVYLKFNCENPDEFFRHCHRPMHLSDVHYSTIIDYQADEFGRLFAASQRLTSRMGVDVLFPEMQSAEIRVRARNHPTVRWHSQSLSTEAMSLESGPPDYVVENEFCFLTTSCQYGKLAGITASRIAPFLSNSFHIPGLRGNPERLYPLTSAKPPYRGVFQQYYATILNSWELRDAEKMNMVVEELRRLELAGLLSSRELDQASVEVLVDTDPTVDYRTSTNLRSIADVGIGVSQVLPFLVALVAAEPGQMVYCEQPELHLHPRAQYRLAGVMVDAMKRGVRIVVETHSALLLTALQTAVAKGELPPDDLKLYWFSRDKNGHARATKANLDSRGRYNDWPVDFGDVELKAISAYMDAAQAQLPSVAS
jgi:hypothetical protein